MDVAGKSVFIPFRALLHPGDTSFVVPVQRKFLDRQFGFDEITLMPEYRNIQAFNYNLDAKVELEAEVSHPLQLEVTYLPSYHSKEEGKSWSYLTSQTKMGTILDSINKHFERHKPPGSYYPVVFFDWFHIEALDEEETIRGHSRDHAQEAYGEEFKPEKHAVWLPASLQDMDQFNDCIFPTVENEEFLAEVHIRMWVGPNVTISFSNSHLPLAMGFEASQIPPKSRRGQILYVNDNPLEYKMFFVWNRPLTSNLPVQDLRGTKMNCYTTKESIMSPVGKLVTTKQREKKYPEMGEDFSKGFLDLGKTLNIYLGLSFDEASQTFKVEFPNNRSIDVRIFLPSSVIKQLGFDPAYGGDCIDQRMVALPVKSVVETDNLVEKSIALVYDTGNVAVDLTQEWSQLSQHSGNLMLTTLSPRLDGTLRNRRTMMNSVYVSRTDPELKFHLYRFDDHGKKSPLDWPVGAYVFGTLSGKV